MSGMSWHDVGLVRVSLWGQTCCKFPPRHTHTHTHQLLISCLTSDEWCKQKDVCTWPCGHDGLLTASLTRRCVSSWFWGVPQRQRWTREGSVSQREPWMNMTGPQVLRAGIWWLSASGSVFVTVVESQWQMSESSQSSVSLRLMRFSSEYTSRGHMGSRRERQRVLPHVWVCENTHCPRKCVHSACPSPLLMALNNAITTKLAQCVFLHWKNRNHFFVCVKM